MTNFTEKEVKDLESQVFEGQTLNREDEIIWCNEQIELNQKGMQKRLALFLYHKALRNDEGMQTVAHEVTLIKKTLDYLTNRLKELNA